ncbi:MAG: hypothetical protein PVF58_09470 [Candidatus Methanofastidiosia archaeon]|jgi:hypothetical protein
MQTVLRAPNSACIQGGKISSSAYDTAWVARVTNDDGTPVFPECIKWIINNQHPDGSWGSEILNYHDRIISTLSAIMALKEIGKTRYTLRIQKGESYIWENIHKVDQDTCKLVGSELLLPSLMEQAESLNLHVPSHVTIYKTEYLSKLKKIDESLWYSPLTTLTHNLEFLGDSVCVDRLSDTLLLNGCVGNSPAATAFYLKHKKDVHAFMFLKEILQSTEGSVMTVYPIEIFEYGWTLYNMMLAGMYFEQYTEICNILQNHFTHLGVGMSAGYPVPDFDDTVIWCKILYEMGYPVDFDILDAYDAGDYYVTYASELDPSVGTNIHVLDFVRSCPDFPNRDEVIEKLLQYIKKEMYAPGYWVDKWHVSPYYATSHAVVSLCDTDPSLAERAVSWIFNTQHENGLWGEGNGTLEETACAVQALMYYHQHVDRIDIEKVSDAVCALNSASSSLVSTALPDLWIGKVLYTPVRIAVSSIASAQFMAEMAKIQMSPVY